MGSKQWVRISKEIEFDAGHRVPAHQSQCRNLHGHRYRVVAECRGTIIEEHGAPDEGMLIDFGVLKTFLNGEVHDVLDHGFIVYRHDIDVIIALQKIGDEDGKPLKVIEFPYIPTAENIARWCYEKLQPLIEHHFRENLILHRIRVWETPTSMACYPEAVH